MCMHVSGGGGGGQAYGHVRGCALGSMPASTTRSVHAGNASPLHMRLALWTIFATRPLVALPYQVAPFHQCSQFLTQHSLKAYSENTKQLKLYIPVCCSALSRRAHQILQQFDYHTASTRSLHPPDVGYLLYGLSFLHYDAYLMLV